MTLDHLAFKDLSHSLGAAGRGRPAVAVDLRRWILDAGHHPFEPSPAGLRRAK